MKSLTSYSTKYPSAKYLPKELSDDQKKNIEEKFRLLAKHPEFKDSIDITRPKWLTKGSLIYGTINGYINTKGLKYASNLEHISYEKPSDIFWNVFVKEVTNKTSEFNISLEQSLKNEYKTKIRSYFFTCCNSYIGDRNREIFPRKQYTVKENDLAQIGDIKKSSVEDFLKDKIRKKDEYLPSGIINLTYKKKNEKKIKLRNEDLGKNFDDLELNAGTTFNFQIIRPTISYDSKVNDMLMLSEADHIKKNIKKHNQSIQKLKKELIEKDEKCEYFIEAFAKEKKTGWADDYEITQVQKERYDHCHSLLKEIVLAIKKKGSVYYE